MCVYDVCQYKVPNLYKNLFFFSCIKRIEWVFHTWFWPGLACHVMPCLAIDVLKRDFRTNFSAYAFKWVLQFHFRTFDYRIKQLPPRSAFLQCKNSNTKKKWTNVCTYVSHRVNERQIEKITKRKTIERWQWERDRSIKRVWFFFMITTEQCYFIILTLNDIPLTEFIWWFDKSAMNGTSYKNDTDIRKSHRFILFRFFFLILNLFQKIGCDVTMSDISN